MQTALVTRSQPVARHSPGMQLQQHAARWPHDQIPTPPPAYYKQQQPAISKKGKVDHAPQKSIGGCSSPSSRPSAHRWRTTNVCDVWPVWRQTYNYLPSPPPIGWYQIILLRDRGTCVNNLPRVALNSGVAGIRTRNLLTTSPAPYHYTTEPSNSHNSALITSCKNIMQLGRFRFVRVFLCKHNNSKCGQIISFGRNHDHSSDSVYGLITNLCYKVKCWGSISFNC